MSGIFFDEQNLLSDDFNFIDGLGPYEFNQTQEQNVPLVQQMQSPQLVIVKNEQPHSVQKPIESSSQKKNSNSIIELSCDNPSPFRKGDDAGEICSYLDNRHPVFRFVWNAESNGIELGLKCVLSKTTQATYRDSRGPVPQNLECIVPIRQICTLSSTEHTTTTTIAKQNPKKVLVQKWTFMPWREVKEIVTEELAKELPYILQKRNVNALRFEVVDIKTEKVLCDRELLYRSSSSSAPSSSSSSSSSSSQDHAQHQQQRSSPVDAIHFQTSSEEEEEQQQPTATAIATTATVPSIVIVHSAPQQQPPTKRRRTNPSDSSLPVVVAHQGEVMLPQTLSIAPTLISQQQQQQPTTNQIITFANSPAPTTATAQQQYDPYTNNVARAFSFTVDSPFSFGSNNQNFIFAQPQPIMLSPDLLAQGNFQFVQPTAPTLLFEPTRRNSVMIAPQGSMDDLSGMYTGMPVQLVNQTIDEFSTIQQPAVQPIIQQQPAVQQPAAQQQQIQNQGQQQQDPVHDLIRICDRIAGGPKDKFQQVGPALCKVMGDLLCQINKPSLIQIQQQDQQQDQQPQQQQLLQSSVQSQQPQQQQQYMQSQ